MPFPSSNASALFVFIAIQSISIPLSGHRINDIIDMETAGGRVWSNPYRNGVPVGSYDAGKVWSNPYRNGVPVGSYEGSGGGGAAAAFILLL